MVIRYGYLNNSHLKMVNLVANFLLEKGWTPEAISATLGNMRHESSVNPNMYEYGKNWGIGDWGFGLVQWTPRSNIGTGL